MKHTIKTTIGIIAIALSSMSIAEARENRSDRNYEKPRQERSHRQENRRKDWNRSSHRQDYKERRHFRKHMRAERKARRHIRKHKRFERHARRHFKAYKRSRGYYSGWRDGHRPYKKAYYRTGSYNYVTPYSSAPSHSTHVSVSSRHGGDNFVPVLAGTLIGSAIANDASNGDPVATFGGAIFGAIVGNAIAHH